MMDAILAAITDARAKTLMIALVQVPSPVTDLMEAEPLLRRFIDTAVEPRLRAMGIATQRDPMGNLAATIGEDANGRSLMLGSHAMNQPAATMPNPYGGEVREGAPYGLPGEVVLGKGISEQKANMAAMLLAIEAVMAAGIPIHGRLVFLCCVSGETGRHDAMRSVVETFGLRADLAVLQGTGNRISLGNRGRVDVPVTVLGAPCHSSRPQAGCNAVTGAMEVIRRVTEGVRLTASHPHLGQPSLAVNRIQSFPESTHTIQDRCEIMFDRRLMPGEDAGEAVAEIARLASAVDGMPDPASGKPWRVSTVRGAVMHPSLVAPDSQIVQAITRAAAAAGAAPPETYFSTTAFDQGYLNTIGIETCNYGPGEEQFAHTDLDMASIPRTAEAARVFAAMILQRLC